jgi:hypothetical protein
MYRDRDFGLYGTDDKKKGSCWLSEADSLDCEKTLWSNSGYQKMECMYELSAEEIQKL